MSDTSEPLPAKGDSVEHGKPLYELYEALILKFRNHFRPVCREMERPLTGQSVYVVKEEVIRRSFSRW